MENLSIIIKEDLKEKIYGYVEILKPLLEDEQTQLVIINNLEEKIEINYNHIIYEFKEDYAKFNEFCDASCFNDNIMIIESGMLLSEKLVGNIKDLLLKYKNINIKADLKRYCSEDKYYIKESYVIYNVETSYEEKLKIEIDDFAYLNNSGVYINHNIFKFIQDNKFEELYLWYKNYIIKNGDIKLKFYDYIEKLKMSIKADIKNEIEKNFIFENLNLKYCEYMTLSKIIDENNLSIDKLSITLKEIRFSQEDSYFRYIIFKLFKDKKYISEMFSLMDIENIKDYMKELFKEYDEFYLNVYDFLISTNLEKLENEEIKNILIYMNIIEIYFENMSSDSAEKNKKEKIVKLFNIYSKYGVHLINNNVSMDIKSKEFLINLKQALNLISLNRFKEAIDILKEICEANQVIMMPMRYYIQKLIYENDLYYKVLSITMIVKNEEKNLERCLKSIKPLIDAGIAELIIVDTGSTDKTVEIARRYTDRVYFHPWQGSFSEARNWSISLSQGEYIFIIDADNEIAKSEVQKCIKFFSSKNYKNYNTFSVNFKDYEDNECKKYSIITQYLIFKNDGSFYYSGNVHNQPNFNTPIKNLDLTLFHYGYIMDSKEIKEGKFKRTANLLKKELQKDPNNIYYRRQLNNSYSMYGNHIESLNQAKLFMKILKKKTLNYEYIMYYANAAMTNFTSKKYDETIKICDDILSLNPDFIDAVFFKAQSLFLKENFEECIEWNKKYLDLHYNINSNPIILDTSIQVYSIAEIELVKSDIETSYLKIKDYLGFLNYVFSYKNKSDILIYISGVIKCYIELKKLKELVLFFEKYILKGTEKEQVIFRYYIKDEIENMDEENIVNLLKEFNNLNKKSSYIDSIKKDSQNKVRNTLKDIIKFLSFQDVETLNIVVMQRLLGNVALDLVNNKDIDINSNEIIVLRKITKYILIQALNKKTFKGLTKEQTLKIISKYIDYSFLVYEKSKESLSRMEILFLENMSGYHQHIQKNDLVSAVRAIRDAVLEDQDMANAMALYIENLINNNSRHGSENKEMENYSLALKNQMNELIEQGIYEDAKKLIKEYETIIENDLEVISMKAVIAILENRLDDAEEILRDGLSIDNNYYDLLYNMAYLQRLKENHFLANYFSEEAKRVSNNESGEKDNKIEIQDKKSQYSSKEEKVRNAPKILIGSTVRQKPLILKEFLQSLSELYIQDYNVNFMFFDDNQEEESSKMLSNFKVDDIPALILSGEKQGEYVCNSSGHKWKDELIWKIAAYKDRIINYAKENEYDYLFLVDSDLVLHPETLEKLISTKKDIVSEVFWTKWDASNIEKPQVWVSENYTLYYKAENETLTQEEIQSRTNAFIKCMRIPGIYEVGGLGACTLISKGALDAGVCYEKIDGVNYMGEDRHFCIRALNMELKLYVETSLPSYHIYREEYLKGVEDYKNKCRKSIIYKYDNFTRTAVKAENNSLTLSMLVRNEADRYLREVLEHASKYIDRAVILDDGSNDNTVEVCKEVLKDIPLTIVSNKVSQFNNEINLRKQLWDMTVETNPDWILCLDADEVFENKAEFEMKNIINQPYYDYYDFRLYDFWDKKYYREDKNWCAHKYYRSFLVRYQPNFKYVWNETPVHCGRLPLNIYNLPGAISNLRIKHYGWSNEEERIEKYNRYMKHDPEGKFGVMEQYKSILDETPNLIEWKE